MSRWLLIAGFLAGCVDADAPTDATSTEKVMFEVPAGSSASRLTGELVTLGVVPGEWSWKWFLRSADAGCVKAGRHELSPSMSMKQVLAALCGPPVPEDEPFTVVEGWRIVEIDAALAAKGWIQAGEYQKLAESKAVDLPFEVVSPTLEGYLFPDTYRIEPKKITAKSFLERQLKTFQERFLKGKDLSGKRLHDVVVLASMIEREEPSKANRPVVAGVMVKRLNAGWNLGIDATSRYTLSQWNDREAFLGKLRDPADPYNTRLKPGLPPTAIGNPGIESLDAAASPQASDWWYYLHDGQGQFHGATDAAGHEANRKRFNVY